MNATRNINADIRSIIINTAIVTVALIMIIIDEVSSGFDCVINLLTNGDVTNEMPVLDVVVGVVAVVGDCIFELITEDVIPRKKKKRNA